MSQTAEIEEDYEGIKWEKELEDDTLAVIQRKLENEFEADFEQTDFEKKGFSSEGLPFYTGLTEIIDYWNQGEIEEIEVTVNRSGEMNEVQYWANNGSVMENFQKYLETHSQDSKGQMLEPYKMDSIPDTRILRLLSSLEDSFEITGPDRNPGNGETRIYPVRMEHREREDIDSIDLEEQLTIGEPGKYGEENDFVPGDARFYVKGETPEKFELDAELRIKPMKRETGYYKLEIDSDSKESLIYLTQYTERILNRE